MRIFEHPNLNDFICPICQTSEDKPVTLIPISGTKDGNNYKARQYHVSCIDLIEFELGDATIIGQIVNEDKER